MAQKNKNQFEQFIPNLTEGQYNRYEQYKADYKKLKYM
jgi:hypothetical protein